MSAEIERISRLCPSSFSKRSQVRHKFATREAQLLSSRLFVSQAVTVFCVELCCHFAAKDMHLAYRIRALLLQDSPPTAHSIVPIAHSFNLIQSLLIES
jgi:hypothetical protein